MVFVTFFAQFLSLARSIFLRIERTFRDQMIFTKSNFEKFKIHAMFNLRKPSSLSGCGQSGPKVVGARLSLASLIRPWITRQRLAG